MVLTSWAMVHASLLGVLTPISLPSAVTTRLSVSWTGRANWSLSSRRTRLQTSTTWHGTRTAIRWLSSPRQPSYPSGLWARRSSRMSSWPQTGTLLASSPGPRLIQSLWSALRKVLCSSSIASSSERFRASPSTEARSSRETGATMDYSCQWPLIRVSPPPITMETPPTTSTTSRRESRATSSGILSAKKVVSTTRLWLVYSPKRSSSCSTQRLKSTGSSSSSRLE